MAIVDDDPGVRGSITSLLRSAGLVGVPFASGEDLLGWPDRHALACIVTDLHMPGMSGMDLQHALNSCGWTQPLIVMTAFPTESVREQMMAAGARTFLTKPVDPEALLDAIEDAIRL